MTGAPVTVGLALAAGMVAQVIARHLGIPGIVLLLGAGVVLGPEVAGILNPDSLGEGMRMLVGFAVAVILFEGGLSLDVRRLKREGKSIRQLVTIGALVTAVGGTLAPMLFLGWGLAPSILFGTLVIVTGPTVVTPLLRRIRVNRRLTTILEAEGVFGDAVGAILAVVALEVIITPALSVVGGAGSAVITLGAGVAEGVFGGLIIAWLLRRERLIPEGLESVTALSLILALYQFSNAILHESGIAAVVVAGLVVGNIRTPVSEELREFKEQLTVMFIGLLFVLLAAAVRLEDVYALGWGGVATVAALMLVVRPLNVWASTVGTEVTLREKIFMSWMAPRGIVAAAVASLFASELAAAGIPGGRALQGLVFLVIAATVLLQGLSGGMLAKALDLTRPVDNGYVILGASALARAVALQLKACGEEVMLIDTNGDSCQAAQDAGLRVFFGSGLAESIQLRAELDSRKGVIAMTPSDSTNMLFVKEARKVYKVPLALATLHPRARITPKLLHDAGGRLLFGRAGDVDHWITHLERGTAKLEQWTVGPEHEGEVPPIVLPLLAGGQERTRLVDEDTQLRPGEGLCLLMPEDRRGQAEAWLAEHAFTRAPG